MGSLTGVSSGKIRKPALVLIYGPDGVGKSSFGAEAPSPIFIGPEDGSSELDVHRFDGVKTFSDVRSKINQLRTDEHSYQTAVIDSIDWLEPLVWREVCAMDPNGPAVIEDAFGGYGKGFTRANQMWKDFMGELKALREEKKMNIIIIAHSQVKTFQDPSQQHPYDRYMLKLNEKAAALWREFVDCVLFANFEVLVKKEKNDRKAKTYGEDVRIMYTHRRPSFDAKNRYNLPFELSLGWSHFEEARGADVTGSTDELLADIGELAEQIPKEARVKMLVAADKAKANVNQLLKIRNHAKTLVEAQ